MIALAGAIGALAILLFVLIAYLVVCDFIRKRKQKEIDLVLSNMITTSDQEGVDADEPPVSLEDLRQQYREAPEGTEGLSVAVAGPEQEAIQVQVVNATIFGMGVFMDKTANIAYTSGEAVYLYMSCPQLEDPIVTPALVCYQTNVKGGSLYGFKFADWLGMSKQLPLELKAMFNKRRERRFVPDPEKPIVVYVHAIDDSFKVKAYLRDVSVSGLAFIVSPSAKKRLASVSDVNVSFCLSDDSETLNFRAGLRPPNPLGKNFSYGAYFDEKHTPSYREMRNSLKKFIVDLEPIEHSAVSA